MLRRLGRVAREARQAAHLTQLDVAQEAGVGMAVISRFENGERWPREIDHILDAYERACGLPEGELWLRACREVS